MHNISMFSCVFKFFSNIIYCRLLDWLNLNSILPDTQFGFRQNKSTEQAAVILIEEVKRRIATYKSCYVCFVDYQKAFDTVDRTLLFQKLANLGLSQHFTTLLYNIYKENLIQVSSDNCLSDPITQNLGVPQGDKLSPILFSIFIADLSKVLSDTQCFNVFYADDLAIVAHNINTLQAGLNSLEKYCASNKLTVNINKTKVMKFRFGGQFCPIYDVLHYNNENLEFVPQFEYLGIVLSNKLAPRAHLDKLLSKSKAAIGSLNKKLDMQRISYTSAVRLLNSVVLPTATYGVNVFGILQSPMLENHLKQVTGIFFKRWLGLNKYTSTTRVLHHLFEDDVLNVRKCRGDLRRCYGAYYSNGLHHALCIDRTCYGRDRGDCECRYCRLPILDENHLEQCLFFDLDTQLHSRIQRIFNDFVQRHN